MSVAKTSAAPADAVPQLALDWGRYGVTAGITTRQGGYSLGLWTSDPSEQVMTRWRAFRDSFAPQFPTVVHGHQVHGDVVRWYENLPPGWLVVEGVDGHATGQPGVLLTVTVADCVPIYLVAPARGVIALLHAGWRGVAGGMLDRGLAALEQNGVSPSELVMHCGVSICGACYEVGYEVAERLTGRPHTAATKVDLRALLADRARALGIRDVSISPHCSAHEPEQFHSHRRSGGRDGRMIAYLGVPLRLDNP